MSQLLLVFRLVLSGALLLVGRLVFRLVGRGALQQFRHHLWGQSVWPTTTRYGHSLSLEVSIVIQNWIEIV